MTSCACILLSHNFTWRKHSSHLKTNYPGHSKHILSSTSHLGGIILSAARSCTHELALIRYHRSSAKPFWLFLGLKSLMKYSVLSFSLYTSRGVWLFGFNTSSCPLKWLQQMWNFNLFPSSWRPQSDKAITESCFTSIG